MNRPYTICYVSTNAEGKIDGDFFTMPEAKIPLSIYRKHWFDFNAQASIYGSVTMAMFADGLCENLPGTDEVYPRTDFIAFPKADKYYVSIDPKGTIAYAGPFIDVKGRGPHGIIECLTEDVSDAYLEYLRENEVSYIFCGKETFDASIMMGKLYRLFHIEKALVSGGAYADWTLVRAGLIDEITIMVIPVIEGDNDPHGAFLKQENEDPAPIGLELINIEKVEGDGFWVTYRPKNRIENIKE